MTENLKLFYRNVNELKLLKKINISKVKVIMFSINRKVEPKIKINPKVIEQTHKIFRMMVNINKAYEFDIEVRIEMARTASNGLRSLICRGYASLSTHC